MGDLGKPGGRCGADPARRAVGPDQLGEARLDRRIAPAQLVISGIGGAVAAAVGERLQRLGARLQVLVVTHSPQVAARGAHHWRVAKRQAERATVTRVEELDADTRQEEIARMLSGSIVTAEARAAAASLIAGARS